MVFDAHVIQTMLVYNKRYKIENYFKLIIHFLKRRFISKALEKVYELRLYLCSLKTVDKNYYDLLNDFEKLFFNKNSNAKQTKITQFFHNSN